MTLINQEILNELESKLVPQELEERLFNLPDDYFLYVFTSRFKSNPNKNDLSFTTNGQEVLRISSNGGIHFGNVKMIDYAFITILDTGIILKNPPIRIWWKALKNFEDDVRGVDIRSCVNIPDSIKLYLELQ